MRVVHLTSVHPRFDSRIFHKQCISLSNEGYDVKLVVADGQGTETVDGIEIIDAGKSGGRWHRIFRTPGRVFQLARSINADIYHLHDPELMLIGLKLKQQGKKVIFDAHEDFPKQILNKHYLPRVLRIPISKAAESFEKWASKKLDAVVTATPYIRDKFKQFKSTVVDINNFPITNELSEDARQNRSSNSRLCYVGGLSEARGVREMIRALEYIDSDVRLNIAGKFNERELQSQLSALAAWPRVDMLGFLDRAGVNKTYQQSFAGLVVLHPIPNYLDALPVKMFEYMCAGLPVIASDFRLWREIIQDAECGICVDPLSPEQIADAVNFLHNNPDVAEQMGLNGRKAVVDKYNWNIEKEKLIQLYEKLNNAE